MSTLDRRSALRLFGAAGLGLAATACAGPGSGSGSADGSASPSGPATAGAVKGTVSFAHWRAEDKAVIAGLTAAFTKRHPGAKVEQDISPSADYQTTALRRIRGSRTGDLFTAFRGAQFEQLVKAGVYAPLTGTGVVKQYQSGLIGPGALKGVQYGLPYQLVFNMPLANTDALDKAGHTGAPKDWDGFLQLLDDLKSKGFTPIAWPGGDAANAGQLLNTMVMNNAPTDDAFTKIESGDYKTTDDWFLTTLKQYAELTPTSRPAPPAPPPTPSPSSSPRARPACWPPAPSRWPESARSARSSPSTCSRRSPPPPPRRSTRASSTPPSSSA